MEGNTVNGLQWAYRSSKILYSRGQKLSMIRAVNKELVGLYWDIGRIIVERQKGGTWGKSVVEHLASDLRLEFPGVKGFSPSNLWRMKMFYENYVESAKLA